MTRKLPILLLALSSVAFEAGARAAPPTGVILVMADDMGWGQTSYYDHPALKTPNLDAMAANGLRFDRFYAGAPNCSPTRATVMTGRTNDRTAVTNHGVPLRPQEFTIAQAMKRAGYATAHFGKWHLNGLRGPGAPILGSDFRNPGKFGFKSWLSVTNFFDMNPILSRQGAFEEFNGDSSEIIVDEALRFITSQSETNTPFFTVIWYGTPHSPFVAFEKDKKDFKDLDAASANHYGELVAMDRSIGTLRKGLRELNIADNTLVWFCSDNGGLPKIQPGTVGNLRGHKNTIYEGGLRVPAIIEWPNGLHENRVTDFPACTMDMLPTLCDIVGDEGSSLPLDGVSLKQLLSKEIEQRAQPIGFRHMGRTAFIDNDYKLLRAGSAKDGSAIDNAFELYDVVNDPTESTNLIQKMPELAQRMIQQWSTWNASVQRSIDGLDYPEKAVVPKDPGPRWWTKTDLYRDYHNEWKKRPEFARYLK